MRNHGPTIDGKKQPEGYITDYTFSTIPTTADSTTQDIFVLINNLPPTATVVFGLETRNMDVSTNQRFVIYTETTLYRKVIATVNSSTLDKTNTVKFIGGNTLRAVYYFKIPSQHREQVRLRYKGW